MSYICAESFESVSLCFERLSRTGLRGVLRTSSGFVGERDRADVYDIVSNWMLCFLCLVAFVLCVCSGVCDNDHE